MYVIKKINVDGNIYLSSEIVDSFRDELETSMIIILENNVKELVKQEYGASVVSGTKIIQITGEDQVSEPIIDGILLYRIENDLTRIHVYCRRSEVVESTGWIYGTIKSATTTFKKTHIFEIEACKNLVRVDSECSAPSPIGKLEIISIGKAGVKIPSNSALVGKTKLLLEELVTSAKFKNKFSQFH